MHFVITLYRNYAENKNVYQTLAFEHSGVLGKNCYPFVVVMSSSRSAMISDDSESDDDRKQNVSKHDRKQKRKTSKHKSNTTINPQSDLGALFIAVDSETLVNTCPTLLQELNRYMADFVCKCKNLALKLTMPSQPEDLVLQDEGMRSEYDEHANKMWQLVCQQEPHTHVLLQVWVSGLSPKLNKLHKLETPEQYRKAWAAICDPSHSRFFARMYIQEWLPHLSAEMRKKVSIRFQQLGYVCKYLLCIPTVFIKQLEKGIQKALKSEKVRENKSQAIEKLCVMATNIQKKMMDGDIKGMAGEDGSQLSFRTMLGFLQDMGDTGMMGDFTKAVSSMLTDELIEKLDRKVEEMKTRHLPEIIASRKPGAVRILLKRVLHEILEMPEFETMIRENKWDSFVAELFEKLEDTDRSVSEVLSEVIANTTTTFTAESDCGELNEEEEEERENLKENFNFMLSWVVGIIEEKIESSMT